MSRRNIGYASQKFQSTLPHGSDHGSQCAKLSSGISIHAPSRERPLWPRYLISASVYFNPRSLTGATLAHITAESIQKFQSTLPHGSDADMMGYRKGSADFNPRSLTGATHCFFCFTGFICYFNPRSLTGATNNSVSVAPM